MSNKDQKENPIHNPNTPPLYELVGIISVLTPIAVSEHVDAEVHKLANKKLKELLNQLDITQSTT